MRFSNNTAVISVVMLALVGIGLYLAIARQHPRAIATGNNAHQDSNVRGRDIEVAAPDSTTTPPRSIQALLDALRKACLIADRSQIDGLVRELSRRLSESFGSALLVIELDEAAYKVERAFWLCVLRFLDDEVRESDLTTLSVSLINLAQQPYKRDASESKAEDLVVHGKIQMPYQAVARSAIARIVGSVAKKGAANPAFLTLRGAIEKADDPRVKAELIRCLIYLPKPNQWIVSYVIELMGMTKDPHVRTACLAVLSYFGGPEHVPELLIQVEESFRAFIMNPNGFIPQDQFKVLVDSLGFKDAMWLLMSWIRDSTDPSLPLNIGTIVWPHLVQDEVMREYALQLLDLATSPMQVAGLISALRFAAPEDARLTQACVSAYLSSSSGYLVKNEALNILARQLPEGVLFPLIMPDFESTEPLLKYGARAAAIIFAGKHPDSQVAMAYAHHFVAQGSSTERIRIMEVVAWAIIWNHLKEGPLVDLLVSLQSDKDPEVAKATRVIVERELKQQK